MSGKLNEFICLFVGEADAPPRWADQRLIETQAPAWPGHFGFFHGALDSGKDELARRTALSGGGFMDPAVKVSGQVD
jgi:hypothetical protein